MIDKSKIQQLLDSELTDSPIFTVSVKVSSTNKIAVFIDSIKDGVTIEDCVKISRLIESNFDRDIEDYELEVSSYGLSYPFVDIRQYIKNIGKQIEVLTSDNQKFKAVITSVDQNIISLETELTKKQLKEGAEKNIQLNINQIKEAKVIISFK